MKKTFKREAINGRKFQFLELPGTDLFKFEIVNLMGAHVERLYKRATGENVYGISHLVEHLGFRCCKDYSSDQLMAVMKREGTYNASTNHERINYWFKTTSDRFETAVNLVCNFALNDLSLLTEEEFETERKTVVNEINRYADDEQTMFYMGITPTFCRLDQEDNILGTPEGVGAITLHQAQMIKQIFLQSTDVVYNVIYDPAKITKDKIVNSIEQQLARFAPAQQSSTDAQLINAICDQYDDIRYNINLNIGEHFEVENGSDQAMTVLLFDVIETSNSVAAKIGNRYLGNLSPTSLFDIIREKNGLTYGTSLYDDIFSGFGYTVFACDVTRGTEDLLMELFEQSIVDSVNNFSREAHQELMSTIKLERTLAYINQEKYAGLFWTGIWNPEIFAVHSKLFENDIDAAIVEVDQECASYSNVLAYLLAFKDWVVERKYGKMVNIQPK